MTDLWCNNTPQNFWLCQPDPPGEIWAEACRQALPLLDLDGAGDDAGLCTCLTLGEGQFGAGHWKLSTLRRLYYALKPLLPGELRHALRRSTRDKFRSNFPLNWPVEDRYVRFQMEIARQLLRRLDLPSLAFRYFWPGDYRFGFVLTHDIESADGQDFVRRVAELEQSLGFRSCFNFVPERYLLDRGLMAELQAGGFEIGVHGLHHDGRLYNSEREFTRRAKRINYYLNEFGAVGFRSPLMMRNPDWLQELNVEYDCSFFDTDPYEPLPGGVMTIWPFFIGHFVELPYTLPQDSTIFHVFCEATPRIWLDKIEFIERFHGMALLNTHPDYLREPRLWKMYQELLHSIQERGGYWQALPCQVARWWRRRFEAIADAENFEIPLGAMRLENNEITLEPLLENGRGSTQLAYGAATNGKKNDSSGIFSPSS